MRLRRTLSVLAVVSVATLGLAACSEDDTEGTDSPAAGSSATQEPSPSDEPSDQPSDEPSDEATEAPAEQVDLDVVYKNGTITPNAQEISVKVGEPLTVRIDADAAGELHVHAKPEQHVEFARGLTTTELVFEMPGSVEIEEHDSGSVIALVEVTG